MQMLSLKYKHALYLSSHLFPFAPRSLEQSAVPLVNQML